MEAWFYPSRFHGLENLTNSCDWMMDLDPWYDYEPFVHHPRRYRRHLPSPYAVMRRGNDDGRISSRRMAPIRSPFNELFKSDFTDDLISLLEHHARKLSSASHAASRDEPGNSPSKDTTPAIASTTSSENGTPSSSRCDIVRKEDIDKTGKPFNVALKLGDFQPENVNVSLDGQKVIVKAKRDEHGDDDSWRRHSQVEYSFMLPEDTPAESLTSSFNKDGILSITAKKDDASNKPLEGPPEKECERKEGQKDGTDDAKGESNTDKK